MKCPLPRLWGALVLCVATLLALLALAPVRALAQATTAASLPVRVDTAGAPPHIRLSWNLPAQTTGVRLWKRVKGEEQWGQAIQLAASATVYADADAQPGQMYEYSLQVLRQAVPTTVYGSLVAGYNLPLVEERGKVLLLVDETMSLPLEPELAQLELDLAADGWQVLRFDVAREQIPLERDDAAAYAPRRAEREAVRNLIRTTYAVDPGEDWSLFLFGRIPIVYSGNIGPDGHGSRAWPTDGYYADVEGNWTDSALLNNSYSDARLRNIAGDGKFDQGAFLAQVKMQTGRVDLSDMPDVPVGVSETELLRRYLVRNYRFRHALPPYDVLQRRGIVDDNFGYFSGEAFAASGWRIGYNFFGQDSMSGADWFDTLGSQSMLLAYGGGGGGYGSISGVGTYMDFGTRDSKAVFAVTFGSYFGKWDERNSVLRAPLAGTADSLGLTNMWSGRGYVHLQHMALGETIGYGTRFTQNHSQVPQVGGWHQNGYYRSITINLMGDPTLRLHFIQPPQTVRAATSVCGIRLNWDASADAQGYHVYRSDSAEGPFTRISGTPATAADPLGAPIVSLTFADTAAVEGESYTYLVRAVRMETSGGGTYANQSTGVLVAHTRVVDVYTAPPPVPLAPAVVAMEAGYRLSWTGAGSPEAAYVVERRDPLTGQWVQIAVVAPGIFEYLDAAAPAAGVVHYRVRARNGHGDSQPTSAVADYEQPGQVRMAPLETYADRADGPVLLRVERVQGARGFTEVVANLFSRFSPPLSNGSLEQWNNLAGVPLRGVPVGWSADGARPIVAEGLTEGSLNSAWLSASATSFFYRNVDVPLEAFRLRLHVAAADPGSASARSLSFHIYGRGAGGEQTSLITMRLVRGSSAGQLTLQTHNGQGWITLAQDVVRASVLDEGTGIFSILHPLELVLDVDFVAGVYNVECIRAGEGALLIDGITAFNSAPGLQNGERMVRFGFWTNLSSAGYGVDDLALHPLRDGGSDVEPQRMAFNWGHGDGGARLLQVPVPDAYEPQLTEVIEVSLEAPIGGAQAGYPQSAFVLLGDRASQSLPEPWQTEAIGTNVFEPGYAEHVDGTFGIAVRSGDLTSATDSLRFVYQPVAGDFQLTARLDRNAAIAPNPRFGIMARATLQQNSAMDALVMNTSNGMFRYLRSTPGATVSIMQTQYSLFAKPYWLRMVREGNTVRTLHSPDGTNWTLFDSSRSWGGAGSTLYVGMFVASNTPPSVGINLSAYARFDEVSLHTRPAMPLVFTASAGVSSGTVELTWGNSAGATAYRVERRPGGYGDFSTVAEVGQPQFTDEGLVVGQPYEYRVYALNPAYTSLPAQAQITLPLSPYGAWAALYPFAVESASDAMADPDNDGMVNLLEYALGTSPLESSVAALPVLELLEEDGEFYHQLRVVRNPLAQDVVFTVERSEDLVNWSTVGLVPLVDTPSLLVVADTSAIGRDPSYLRLRIGNDVATPAQGTLRIDLKDNGAQVFLGQPFSRAALWRGVVTEVTADNALSAEAQWQTGAFAAGAYYIEILSGQMAGFTATITNHTHNTLQLDAGIAAYTLEGESFAIRQHDTLESLFGAAGSLWIGGAPSLMAADEIRLFDVQQQSHNSYYYKTSGIGGSGWRIAGNVAASHNSVVVAPMQGLAVLRRTQGWRSIVFSGEARTGAQVVTVSPGVNWLTVSNPLAISIGDSGLYTGSAGSGVAAGASSAVADGVLLNDASGDWLQLYYKSGGIGGSGWRAVGNVSADQSGQGAQPGAVIVIRRVEPYPFLYRRPAY